MEILINAIDKLANSMRLYAEASVRAKKLFLMDKEEAINNLDRAFESKLEAFHIVYDITKNKGYIDFFNHADTALLILLRNAIHHRDHLLFKSWNFEMHLNSGMKKKAGTAFLMAGYETTGDVSEYYFKISDFYERLKHPKLKSFAKQHQVMFEDELLFADIISKAKSERYPIDQIYLNVIPIYISAISRVFKSFKDNEIEFKGFDSEVYFTHFVEGELANLNNPTYKSLRLPAYQA